MAERGRVMDGGRMKDDGRQSEEVGKYGQVMFACQGEGGNSVTYYLLTTSFWS